MASLIPSTPKTSSSPLERELPPPSSLSEEDLSRVPVESWFEFNHDDTYSTTRGTHDTSPPNSNKGKTRDMGSDHSYDSEDAQTAGMEGYPPTTDDAAETRRVEEVTVVPLVFFFLYPLVPLIHPPRSSS